MGRNPKYRDFSGSGGDCTNFVSQCVVAGGGKMNKPKMVWKKPDTYGTTKYWYSIKYQDWNQFHGSTAWKITTSWMRVSDFYTYWKTKVAKKVKEYSKTQLLKEKLKLGDVIQLKGADGVWYHSIIISCKKGGEWRYAGHSDDYVDKKLSLLPGGHKTRVIRPR